VARAEAQLASAQALLSATLAGRTVLKHAIAVLVDANPSTFSVPVAERDTLVHPTVPVGVPSQLLERRPDIASAERQMAAANANIGITTAAFYPNITISATGWLRGHRLQPRQPTEQPLVHRRKRGASRCSRAACAGPSCGRAGHSSRRPATTIARPC